MTVVKVYDCSRLATAKFDQGPTLRCNRVKPCCCCSLPQTAVLPRSLARSVSAATKAVVLQGQNAQAGKMQVRGEERFVQ
jgi:hypothetical protein